MTELNSDQRTRGWEQARQAIADLRAARDVPREEFPGHKEIYCSNLEGFLGGRFPALLAERDELLEAATAAVLDALSWMDPEIAAKWRAESFYKRLAALLSHALDQEDASR